MAYVSNYGGGAYNTLAVIDLMEQKALPSIDLDHCAVRTASRLWAERSGLRLKRPRPSGATTPRKRRLIGFWEQVRIDSHDFRFRRPEADFYHEREFGYGDHDREACPRKQR